MFVYLDGTETELESEYESDSEPELPDQPENAESVTTPFTDLFRWLLILILTWHIAHTISGTPINELLQFIARGFSIASSLFCLPVGLGLSAFPASLYLAYKYLNIEMDDFHMHVLCPRCYALYNYSESVSPNLDGSYSVKRCAFPLHPQRNRRLPCNSPLVRPIHLSSGARRLYALHTYVSKSFKDSLQRILLRKDNHLKLEAWRNRTVSLMA